MNRNKNMLKKSLRLRSHWRRLMLCRLRHARKSVGDRYGQNYLKASADFGANGIMKKPFTADELMNQVSYWLSQTR